jgi:hypothetical protein
MKLETIPNLRRDPGEDSPPDVREPPLPSNEGATQDFPREHDRNLPETEVP